MSTASVAVAEAVPEVRDRADIRRQVKLVVTFGIATVLLVYFALSIDNPTVQYVLGDEDEWWPKPDGEDLEVDDPYNTYLNAGLPPGPIANPGQSAIVAVLNADGSDYFYFVATGDDRHEFATTYTEHLDNLCEFQDTCG